MGKKNKNQAFDQYRDDESEERKPSKKKQIVKKKKEEEIFEFEEDYEKTRNRNRYEKNWTRRNSRN